MTPQKILVFGKTGQLASALARAAHPPECQMLFLDRSACDLENPIAAADAIRQERPDLVINAAAYTFVDRAEDEMEKARAINALSPAAMAQACAGRDIPFITFSTDYVFDGEKAEEYCEDDPVNPVSVYGRTKEEGEALVRRGHRRHLIFRTSWIYSAGGANFVRTMLHLGAQASAVRVVSDQVGKPTSAGDLAGAAISAAQKLLQGCDSYGTYHVAGAGHASRYDFAECIFAGARARGMKYPQTLERITSFEFPQAARRPLNCRLATAKFESAFGVSLPPWRDSLSVVLDELAAGKPA
jgi:dTDP-4-dehydrorhamnose reductase